MQGNLTKGYPIRVILKFMIPLFIGNIFQVFYNMVDTIIVGRYVSADALAAVGSTGSVMFLIIGFCGGLTTGFTVLTSQRFGAGDKKGMKVSVANAVILSVIVTVVMTSLSLLLLHPILKVMNTPKEIYEMAYSYISTICIGIVFSVAYNLLSSLLRSIGNSTAPLFFLVFSACLNVALDLMFVITFKMGVAGAAWATNVAQGLSAVLCAIYIVIKNKDLVPERGMWHLDKKATAFQMTVGMPMALQFSITASGTVVMQTAVNLFGATAVAAFTAANKVHNLMMQAMMSMGQAMATYCGQNMGAGYADRISKGVRSSVITMTVYSILSGIAVVWLLKPLMGIFFSGNVDMASMMPYAKIYIVQCALFYIPLSYIFIFRNTMQGCGYGLLPMLGGVVEMICRVSVAVLSMHLMSYRLAAFCDPAAWIGAGLFTGVSYIFVMKKVYRTLSGKNKTGA
jgi:putative MATE family efflux protein